MRHFSSKIKAAVDRHITGSILLQRNIIFDSQKGCISLLCYKKLLSYNLYEEKCDSFSISFEWEKEQIRKFTAVLKYEI